MVPSISLGGALIGSGMMTRHSEDGSLWCSLSKAAGCTADHAIHLDGLSLLLRSCQLRRMKLIADEKRFSGKCTHWPWLGIRSVSLFHGTLIEDGFVDLFYLR